MGNDLVEIGVDGSVATVRINRPPVNAINLELLQAINEAAIEVSDRRDIRAVVLWGGEASFAAGADINVFLSWDHAEAVRQTAKIVECLSAVAAINKPTIAAVTGFALGGGLELALACDLRFFAEDAKVGLPEITLGIIPLGGGSQRLPRLVGPATAKELIFTGRLVGAEEALKMGLADRVAPASDVYEKALKFATRVAKGPPAALAAAKVAIDRGLEVDLGTGLQIERMLGADLFATKDRIVGMKSFLENGPGQATFEGE